MICDVTHLEALVYHYFLCQDVPLYTRVYTRIVPLYTRLYITRYIYIYIISLQVYVKLFFHCNMRTYKMQVLHETHVLFIKGCDASVIASVIDQLLL